MKDDVIFVEKNRELTARLKAEIDHHTSRSMREKIDRMLFEKKPRVLVLDFSEVAFMDSSGLGLILGRVETATGVGAVVEVCGLSAPLLKLVRLSGLERVRNLSVRI